MNNFKNLYRYSFGYENPTIGILYAMNEEDAKQQIEEAYGYKHVSLHLSRFETEKDGAFNLRTGKRSNKVMEVVNL